MPLNISGVADKAVKALKKYYQRWLIGLVLTLLACLQLTGVLHLETIDRMETAVADFRMRFDQAELDPRIVIVDIDSKSLTEVGRFPWSRNHVADLVRQLTEKYQVTAVGFDVSFPEPDTSSGYGVLQKLAQNELKQVPGLQTQLQRLESAMDYDGLLAESMKGRPVVLGYNLSGTEVKGVLPQPAFTEEKLNGRALTAIETRGYEGNIKRLQDAAATAGSFSVVTDPDGVVRSTALLQKVGAGYYATLSLATVAVAINAYAITPIWEGTVDTLSDGEKASGGVEKIAMFSKEGNRLIPVGDGLVTRVQFRGKGGPDGGAFRYVSAVDVMRGTVPQEVLEGAIVLVGTTAPGLNDLRATPVNAEYPGVEIHANIIKSILDDQFKVRPDYWLTIELGMVVVLGLLLTLALPVLSPLWAITLSLAAMAAAAAANYYAYVHLDWVLGLALILLLAASLFVFNVAWGYFFEVRRGQALVSRFGEYVAPELVAEMAEDPAKYNMDGESRELTVLFVDVRGFTTISEGLTPKQLREYINIYLTAMSKDIRDYYRGTLDKYIGDAVMAFWGAPVAFSDHASRGVATALKMQESAHKLNDDFIKRGWPELKIGIGLNSGPMHVGDMGSEIRRAYTVMGDAVNLGSRLEGITKVYGVGICVGEVTRHAASEFAYRELDLVKVKGKNEPVAIFEPVALDKDLPEADRAEIARWNDALALVRRQQWDAAQALLESLNAAHPRGLYTLYLERIAIYREQPPVDDWDGVTKFETK